MAPEGATRVVHLEMQFENRRSVLGVETWGGHRGI